MDELPSKLASRSADQVLMALETVGRAGSVALARGQHIIACLETPPEFGSAKTLASTIEKLMKQEEVAFDQLSAIGVTVGPGSFTGLRVGVATAKALGFGLTIPTVSVDSLEAMARAIQTSVDVEAWTVLDAFRNQLFVAKWSIQVMDSKSSDPQENRQVTPVISTRLMANRDWLEAVHETSTPSSKRYFAGPGLLRIDKENAKKLTQGGSIWNPDLTPKAIQVAQLSWEKFVRGELDDPFDLMPRYFRGSAAEEAKRSTRLADCSKPSA